MEITQIEHFVAIATAGSYGRASAKLGVTQSALSKSVKRLEQYLSCPLFERTTRGVRLTHYGDALLPHFKEILNERRRAQTVVAALNGHAVGNVRIGVARHLADGMLPTVLNDVLAESQRFSIEVEAGYLDELRERLTNAELDVVFASCNSNSVGQHLAFEKLSNNDSIMVTRATPGSKTPPAQSEVTRRRWIISAVPHIVASFERERSSGAHADRPPPVVTNSAALTRALLSTGNFVTICSRASIQNELASGLLVQVDLPFRSPFPPLGLLTRRRGYKTAALQAVIQAFRRHARGG